MGIGNLLGIFHWRFSRHIHLAEEPGVDPKHVKEIVYLTSCGKAWGEPCSSKLLLGRGMPDVLTSETQLWRSGEKKSEVMYFSFNHDQVPQTFKEKSFHIGTHSAQDFGFWPESNVIKSKYSQYLFSTRCHNQPKTHWLWLMFTFEWNINHNTETVKPAQRRHQNSQTILLYYETTMK